LRIISRVIVGGFTMWRIWIHGRPSSIYVVAKTYEDVIILLGFGVRIRRAWEIETESYHAADILEEAKP